MIKCNKNSVSYSRKPSWIRSSFSLSQNALRVSEKIKKLGLHTVCCEAACPNKGTCWNNNEITFLIMGRNCTRNCKFCNVEESKIPEALDPNEPEKIAEVLNELGTGYAVITSVTRDDLHDFGSSHFVQTVQTIKDKCNIHIELLIPDLKGNRDALTLLMEANVDVIGHNLETVESLYKKVRPLASYEISLSVLRFLKSKGSNFAVKSSLMIGLGETLEEILDTAREAYSCGVDIFYIGQYLQPGQHHVPVEKYYTPLEFEHIAELLEKIGFSAVLAGPLVRSSYKAKESYEKYKKTQKE